MDELKPATELQQFYDKLENADWYYDFSDDGRVWRKGAAAFEKLQAEANANPAKRALYDAFHQHMFSGDPWKTVRAPKPERP